MHNKSEISRKIAEALRDHKGNRVCGVYAYSDSSPHAPGGMEAGVVLHTGPGQDAVVPFQTFSDEVDAYDYKCQIEGALSDIAGLILAALATGATADAR